MGFFAFRSASKLPLTDRALLQDIARIVRGFEPLRRPLLHVVARSEAAEQLACIPVVNALASLRVFKAGFEREVFPSEVPSLKRAPTLGH